MEQAGNLLAVTTGLRISELQGLTHGDINFRDNYITVRRSWNNALHAMNEETKTGKERRIFFSNIIKEKLILLIKDNPYKESPDNFLF
jgi:integrase